MATRIGTKFDFIFKDKEEKKRFLGLLNLYLEDLANEFELELEGNKARRLNFDKLGTRTKNNIWNYVVGKLYNDKRAISEEIKGI